MKKNIPILPKVSGVYLFKDAQGKVIYIGKAKNIQKRVSSYFHNYAQDWKVKSLIDDHASVDYILTSNETEALLLEAQLIRDNQPRYNVLLKNGQPFVYIHVTNAEIPALELVRNKKSKGTYIGPFLHKTQARKVYNFLKNTFALNLCNKKIENGCLDYHIGRCAGSCLATFDTAEYLVRLGLALNTLQHDQKTFIKTIKERINHHNAALEFEKSKYLNEYLENADIIFETIRTKFSERKFEHEAYAATTPLPAELQEMTADLRTFLKTDHSIRTIDCFDISHFQSSYLVGACVRFTDGKPDKNNFRRFKIKTLVQQNDYAALQEIVTRRYKDTQNLPDLIVIDGGKGQLSSVRQVLPDATLISLAKREETIFGANLPPEGLKLDNKTPEGRILLALRDYTHHFAISYHRLLRSKNNSI